MTRSNPLVATLLDALATELQSQWSQERGENITVSRSDDTESQTSPLVYSSWTLSIDPATGILIGATTDTLLDLCELGAEASPEEMQTGVASRFSPGIHRTVQRRFGLHVTCTEDPSDEPPAEWNSARLTIIRESGVEAVVHVIVSPALESALGIPVDSDNTQRMSFDSQPANTPNSAEILMDIEMPVSIALGRAKMHLKELLHLTNGSVVELDQELGDEVEIRVNNHLIAYGEAVAVDGNYAVRVTRMAIPRDATLRGILPERVA